MAHELPALLADKIDAARVISFDVFDTLIFRPVAEPHHLFALVQPYARQLMGDAFFPFTELRRTAELETRAVARNKQALEEITYDALYEQFAQMANIPAHDGRIAKLKQYEMETELGLCFTLPSRKAMYDYAVSKGKTIVIASDMYLPRTWLDAMLKKNGFDQHAHVFLSSELTKTKHYGTMFAHMLHTLNATPAEVLHVGDNVLADVKSPSSYGIVTHHIPKPLELFLKHPRNAQIFGGLHYHSDIQLSVMLAAWMHRYADKHYTNEQALPDSVLSNSWEDFGFYAAGPLYLGFTQWLIHQAKKQDIKHLMFLARDGKILEQVYAVLAPIYRPEAKAHYVYASRRALQLSRIVEPLDTLAYEYLCSAGIPMTVRQYLDRLHYSFPHAEAVAKAVGFESLDTLVEHEHQRKQLRELFRQLAPELSAQTAKEREAALVYYHQLPVAEKGRVAMVDIGWSGNTHYTLQEAMLHLAEPIRAFFLGTHHGVRRVEETGLYADSYLYHAGQPENTMADARQCLEILELLFTANDGSVSHFEINGKHAAPVFDALDNDERRQRVVQGIQQGAMEFIKALDPVLRYLVSFPPLMAKDALHPLAVMLRSPVAKEVTMFDGIIHIQTFGQADLVRGIAPKLSGVPFAWLNPWFFAREFQRSYWKTGFIQRLMPYQRVYLKLLLRVYLRAQHYKRFMFRVKHALAMRARTFAPLRRLIARGK